MSPQTETYRSRHHPPVYVATRTWGSSSSLSVLSVSFLSLNPLKTDNFFVFKHSYLNETKTLGFRRHPSTYVTAWTRELTPRSTLSTVFVFSVLRRIGVLFNSRADRQNEQRFLKLTTCTQSTSRVSIYPVAPVAIAGQAAATSGACLSMISRPDPLRINGGGDLAAGYPSPLTLPYHPISSEKNVGSPTVHHKHQRLASTLSPLSTFQLISPKVLRPSDVSRQAVVTGY